MTDEAIFEDTSNVIFNALKELKGKSSDLTGISSLAMEVSLGKLA